MENILDDHTLTRDSKLLIGKYISIGLLLCLSVETYAHSFELIIRDLLLLANTLPIGVMILSELLSVFIVVILVYLFKDKIKKTESLNRLLSLLITIYVLGTALQFFYSYHSQEYFFFEYETYIEALKAYYEYRDNYLDYTYLKLLMIYLPILVLYTSIIWILIKK